MRTTDGKVLVRDGVVAVIDGAADMVERAAIWVQFQVGAFASDRLEMQRAALTIQGDRMALVNAALADINNWSSLTDAQAYQATIDMLFAGVPPGTLGTLDRAHFFVDGVEHYTALPLPQVAIDDQNIFDYTNYLTAGTLVDLTLAGNNVGRVFIKNVSAAGYELGEYRPFDGRFLDDFTAIPSVDAIPEDAGTGDLFKVTTNGVTAYYGYTATETLVPLPDPGATGYVGFRKNPSDNDRTRWREALSEINSALTESVKMQAVLFQHLMSAQQIAFEGTSNSIQRMKRTQSKINEGIA